MTTEPALLHLIPPESVTVPASDLDRLGLCLGLTPSDLDFLLDLDGDLPLMRLEFEPLPAEILWKEKKRIYNSRYYRSVCNSPGYRERQRSRFARRRRKPVKQTATARLLRRMPF